MNHFYRHGYLLTFISILFTQVLLPKAYAEKSLPEKFTIHIDRPIYITGETIWYKIYNSNFQTFSDHSEVAYINLHDKNGHLLLQQKLKLNQGISFGSIDIQRSWKEDYYYLTCFTKWNLQFGAKGLAIKRIPIYNPFENRITEKYDAPGADMKMQQDNFADAFKKDNLVIKLEKEIFARRESVDLKISSDEALNGNFSISIHSLNGFDYHEYLSLCDNAVLLNSSAHYTLEAQHSKEKELMIEGSARYSDSGNPVKSEVISIYKVGSDEFYRTTSKDGIIRSRIYNFNINATFQIFNMNPYQPSIPTFNLKVAGEKLLGFENKYDPPLRNESINNYLKNLTLGRKIHEIFAGTALDSLQGRQFAPIPLKADKVYLMEKYRSMKTLEEFLNEIVFLSQLKVVDGKTTVRLKNTETQRVFMEKPWYLVDGFLTRDEQLVLDIPFKNLIRVEIFNTNKSIVGQLETVMIRSGLIAVYTDNYYLKNIIGKEENIFDFKGYSISKNFVGAEEISYSESRENPYFESLLYWNPNVELVNSNQIEFVTSDLLGDFIIRIEGITENGQSISSSKIFSVKN